MAFKPNFFNFDSGGKTKPSQTNNPQATCFFVDMQNIVTKKDVFVSLYWNSTAPAAMMMEKPHNQKSTPVQTMIELVHKWTHWD